MPIVDIHILARPLSKSRQVENNDVGQLDTVGHLFLAETTKAVICLSIRRKNYDNISKLSNKGMLHKNLKLNIYHVTCYH